MGIFIDGLKADVKKIWNAQIDSHTFNGLLPSKIKYVCFADLSKPLGGEFKDIGNDLAFYEGRNAQLFFYPTGSACEMPFPRC